MIYVTYRSAKATVQSMLAVGQTDSETAGAAMNYISRLKDGESWIKVRDQLYLKGVDSEDEHSTGIVEQIEKDASVNSEPIKRI